MYEPTFYDPVIEITWQILFMMLVEQKKINQMGFKKLMIKNHAKFLDKKRTMNEVRTKKKDDATNFHQSTCIIFFQKSGYCFLKIF